MSLAKFVIGPKDEGGGAIMSGVPKCGENKCKSIKQMDLKKKNNTYVQTNDQIVSYFCTVATDVPIRSCL